MIRKLEHLYTMVLFTMRAKCFLVCMVGGQKIFINLKMSIGFKFSIKFFKELVMILVYYSFLYLVFCDPDITEDFLLPLLMWRLVCHRLFS